jgi:hypothetical protein
VIRSTARALASLFWPVVLEIMAEKATTIIAVISTRWMKVCARTHMHVTLKSAKDFRR